MPSAYVLRDYGGQAGGASVLRPLPIPGRVISPAPSQLQSRAIWTLPSSARACGGRTLTRVWASSTLGTLVPRGTFSDPERGASHDRITGPPWDCRSAAVLWAARLTTFGSTRDNVPSRLAVATWAKAAGRAWDSVPATQHHSQGGEEP